MARRIRELCRIHVLSIQMVYRRLYRAIAESLDYGD